MILINAFVNKYLCIILHSSFILLNEFLFLLRINLKIIFIHDILKFVLIGKSIADYRKIVA